MNYLMENELRVERWSGFLLSGITVAAWLVAFGTAFADDSSLPAHVIEFVGRRASCIEWAKKAADPKQQAQAHDMLRLRKCADIKGEEQTLRASYANDPSVIAALNSTWTKVVVRLPFRAVVPPSEPND